MFGLDRPTDRPLFEAVALLGHDPPAAGPGAGRPLGPLAPPVGGDLLLVLQAVGRSALLLVKWRITTHRMNVINTMEED